nr:gtp-binding protein rho3 [Quercus suber]
MDLMMRTSRKHGKQGGVFGVYICIGRRDGLLSDEPYDSGHLPIPADPRNLNRTLAWFLASYRTFVRNRSSVVQLRAESDSIITNIAKHLLYLRSLLPQHTLNLSRAWYFEKEEPEIPSNTSNGIMPLCGGSKTVQRKLVLLEPTVFENYVHDIFIDNHHVELSLWDTAGQEEFDRLRSLSYDDTHAIMLCFSVDSPDSLENVESKWVGEIAENCPNVKLVLVALKCDLREKGGDEEEERMEPKKPMIDYKQGLAVAEKIKALRYLGSFSLALRDSLRRYI